MKAEDIWKEAKEGERRIRQHISETPLEYSPYLSQLSRSHVFLKLENFQISGSFKLRGAANKILSLSPQDRKKSLITASSGNHGAAFVHLLERFNL